jgi:hypothetical protein
MGVHVRAADASCCCFRWQKQSRSRISSLRRSLWGCGVLAASPPLPLPGYGLDRLADSRIVARKLQAAGRRKRSFWWAHAITYGGFHSPCFEAAATCIPSKGCVQQRPSVCPSTTCHHANTLRSISTSYLRTQDILNVAPRKLSLLPHRG